MNKHIEDICKRVFGAQSQIQITDNNAALCIHVFVANKADPLTVSQQEMDVILSLQHLLGATELTLDIH